MENLFVSKLLHQNEILEEKIFGMKEYSVVPFNQIDLVFHRDWKKEKSKDPKPDNIILCIECKKYMFFNAIDGFDNEQIKGFQKDFRKLNL